ncbi:MAG TPA: type 1 glutamine amidotransferase [Beutenbergiaceae bacterium]|nr:type 1 glutamine amidotransferase [Beutenbergiaceae bacterium]
MRPRVLVIRNDPRSTLGRYQQWLQESGLEPVLHPGEDGLPSSLAGFHALIMLGGGLMPDDDEKAPWLPDERALVTQAIDEQVPILGICLGAQVLALVAGGQVRANYGTIERGATRMELRAEAGQDSLFAGVPQVFHAIQNHRDTITALPPQAVHLATNQACPFQSFRVGPVAWGVQFHPEASSVNVTRWSHEGIRADGFDPADLIAQAEAVEAQSQLACRTIADNFAQVVLERAAEATPAAQR